MDINIDKVMSKSTKQENHLGYYRFQFHGSSYGIYGSVIASIGGSIKGLDNVWELRRAMRNQNGW